MSTDGSDNALLLESLAWDIPKDLNELSTTRLCLVQWHPLATEEAKQTAELIYWRRRNRAQAAAAVARNAAERERSNTEDKVKEETASSAPAEASTSAGPAPVLVPVAAAPAAETTPAASAVDKKETAEPIDKPAVAAAANPYNSVPGDPRDPPVNAPAAAQAERPAESNPVLAEAPAGEDAAARDVRYAAYQAMLRRQIEHDKQRRQIEADRRLAEQMAQSQEMRQQHNVQVARRARQERPATSSSSSSNSPPVAMARNRANGPGARPADNTPNERNARRLAEEHARLHRNSCNAKKMTFLEQMEADNAARVAEAKRKELAEDAPPQRGPANIAPLIVPRPGVPARPPPPVSPERQRILDEARLRMRALEQPRHLPDAAARRRRFEVLCDSLGNPQTPAGFLEALNRAHTALQAKRSAGIPDYDYWKNKADYITLLAQERERRNRAFQAGLDALEQERLRRVDDRADLASIADSAEDLEGEVLRRRRSMAPTPSSIMDAPPPYVKAEADAASTAMDVDPKEEEEMPKPVRRNSLDAESEADRQARSNAPTPAAAGSVRFRDQESVIPTSRYNSPETKPVVKSEPKSEEKPNIPDENGNDPGQGPSSAANSSPTGKRKREEEDTPNGTREPGTPPPRNAGNDQKKAKIEEESPAIVKLEEARSANNVPSTSARSAASPSTFTSTSTSTSASASVSASNSSPAHNAINRPSSRSATPSSSTSEDTSRAKVPAEYVSDLICLYVGNIPSSITADELRTWLLESMPDLPRPAAVCRANRSVGADTYYARVYYATQAEAERVLVALRKRTIGIQGAKPSLAIVKQKMSKLTILWSDLEQWAKDRLAQRMGRAPVASTSEQSIRGIAPRNGLPARPTTSTPVAQSSTSSAAAAPLSTSSSVTATSRSPSSSSIGSGSRALEAMSAPQESLPMAQTALPALQRRRASLSAPSATLEARLEQPAAAQGTSSSASRPGSNERPSLQERLGDLRNATPNGSASAAGPSARTGPQNPHNRQSSASTLTPTASRAARQEQANGHQVQVSSAPMTAYSRQEASSNGSGSSRSANNRQDSLLSRLSGSATTSNSNSSLQPDDNSRNTPKARSNSTDLLSRLG